MKKFLASLLAFAMVVTGLYLVNPAEAKAAAAVDKSMLGVEAFVTADKVDGKYIIRFVSTVDSLDYENVGFDITYPDGTTETITMKRVFSKIDSSIGEMDNGEEDVFGFSPSLISSKSKYFMTTKLEVTDEAGVYTATAFCTTKDGTKVTGATKAVTLADLQGKTVNVTVPVEFAEGATLTATYGEATAASVALVTTGEGFSIVRIQLADNAEAASLKSVTKFTISDGTTSKDVIYRNYKTTHKNPASDTTTTVSDYNADTSWYDVDTTATEFILATSADMYGFAALVNGGQSFAGKKVTLVSDVALNDGVATKSTASAAPSWTPANGAAKYQWPLIGNGTEKVFSGTFDGSGNTITGLYKSGSKIALFGYVGGTDVAIKNVQVANSYMESGSYNLGGLITYCQEGNILIENVYLDLILKTTGCYVGGFVSTMNANANVTINNSWFAGEIYSTRTASSESSSRETSSMFVAYQAGANTSLTITNCMNTGSFNGFGGNHGTFFGYTSYGTKTYAIKNCVDLGSATFSGSTINVGMIIGQASGGGGTVVLSNIYVSDVTGRPANNIGNIADADILDVTTENVQKVAASVLTNLSVNEIKAFFPVMSTETTSPWTTAKDGNLVLKVFEDWLYPTAPVAEETPTPTPTPDPEPTPEPETAVPDTTWYNETDTEFVLTKRAQLYGLAQLVNAGNSFAGKTIKLGKNITLNDNIDVNAWKTTAPTGLWVPIGTAENPFAGTFDGQGYKLSGLYLSATTAGAGMFGTTASTAVIQNFKLVDSYMKTTAESFGLVGTGSLAKMENIYMGATIESTANWVGGFMGILKSNGGTTYFKNCWFDGTITQTGTGIYGAGGFVAADGEKLFIEFQNCLNSGTISGVSKVGGFMGWLSNYMAKDAEIFKNCLSVGDYEATAYATYCGTYFGQANTSPYGVTATNTYGVGSRFIGVYRAADATYEAKFESDTYIKTLDYIKTTDIATLFPLLEGETASPWEAVSGSTPVLKNLK